MVDPIRTPIRFEPFFRPMIWGGRKIARFLGKNLPPTTAIGESWEVSDHPLHHSRLATASGFGVSLRELMLDHRHSLLGSAVDRFLIFPWLIKLLDAQDWLSVQVHPDESAAAKHCPGESAKTEAWYILDAEPQGRIFAGLLPGVDAARLRHSIQAGKVQECLHSFAPRRGDFIFLPAGTVHAVGGGVLLAEIQQTSNATYRIFDWNRLDAQGMARTLHVEQALAAIRWDQGPITPMATANETSSRLHLVSCPYFELDLLRALAPLTLGGIGTLQALVITEGHGRFANGEYVLPGDAWILPAAMNVIELQPEQPITAMLATLL